MGIRIAAAALCAAALAVSGMHDAALGASPPKDQRAPFGGGRAFFHYPRYHEYQLDDVRVKVSFDEVKGIVYGDTTNTLTTIQPQTTFVDFDSAGLRYSRIALPGGFALRYQTFGETLRVFLPSAAPAGTKLAIEAVYSATPNKGLYFVRPDSWYPDRPWEVWSQGEMTDNHSWFPTYDWPDMPATSETIVTVPKGQIVVSNGRLASVTHDAAAGTDTFDWVESAPHSTYLISIVAGTFAQVTDHLGSLPVTYYAPPDLKSTVAFDFRKTPDMIDFFSKFNGVPYPYEKYAQSAVVDFTYGGMENISATTQTSRTLHDRRSELDSDSEGLVAHELAHQWWGDDETMEDWGQMWLNEGYAVYYEALYRGHAHGKDAFDMDRLGMIQAVMAEDVTVRHPVVTETYAEPIDMFDNIGYGKAALVLHMLRTMLGDDVYRKAQTAFLTQYQHKTANTAQWEAAFEASTGQDLHWFVDEWLYQAGFPEYTVSYTYDDVAKVLHLSVAQTQDTAWNTPAVFTMPIDVLVQTPDGSTTNTVIHDDQRQQTFDIPASAQPAMVLFDPGQNVLSTVSFPKSDAELAYQMRHATSVLDRLSAAETIFSINRLTKLEFVGLTPFEAAQARWYLHSEPVADARAQFITTFARWVQSPDARDIVVAELGDQSAHVRLASATALASFPPDAAGTRALRAHAAGDPSYATIAACIRTLADWKAPDLNALLAGALGEPSTNGVIASAALFAYSVRDGAAAIPLETGFARYGAPLDSRGAAIDALSRIGAGHPAVTKFLESLIGDPDFRTNLAVLHGLSRLGDPSAIPALLRYAQTEQDDRLKSVALDAAAALRAPHHAGGGMSGNGR